MNTYIVIWCALTINILLFFLNFCWSCTAPSFVRYKVKKRRYALEKRANADVLATWCAPRAPTLVSRLQICGSIVIQAAERGNWAAVHSEHWGQTAAKRLVYRWNSSAMASLEPNQKTNGDGSPIQLEKDEVKRVWLQLHKYLAQCQFDIRIRRGSLRAAKALVSSAVHRGPVELTASSCFSLTANTMSKWLKLRSLRRRTISCGNCDGSSHPACHNPS